MRITEHEIRRMSNFSDKGLLRYIEGAKPKINLDQVIEKTKPLAEAARISNDIKNAERFDDLIEAINKIKSDEI